LGSTFANQQAVAFDKKLLTDLQGKGMTPIQPDVPAFQKAVQPALQEMIRNLLFGRMNDRSSFFGGRGAKGPAPPQGPPGAAVKGKTDARKPDRTDPVALGRRRLERAGGTPEESLR
jgi:hypothetical protein